MSMRYKVRPSEIMGISDPYTAFCFDEACYFIEVKIKDMKENEIESLNFIEDRENQEKEKKRVSKRYQSYSELVREVKSN